jgi:hypothetical protein
MTENHWKCKCSGELLDLYVDPEFGVIEISLYEAKWKKPNGLKQKWNHIKRTIRHGDPYSDMLDIDADQAIEIGNAFLAAAKVVQNASSADLRVAHLRHQDQPPEDPSRSSKW